MVKLVHQTQHVLLAMSITILLAACGQQDQAAQQPPATLSVSNWLAKLESPRFIDREDATQALMTMGVEAVEPVKLAVKSGGRETITRGSYVLLKLAMSEDGKLANQAYDALREIEETKQRAAANVASKHIVRIHNQRHDQALAQLLELGAEINEEPVLLNPVGLPTTVRTLRVGEQWKGKSTDLDRLKWMYNVRYLFFTNKAANDAWLAHAAKMPALEGLSVREGNISDKAFTEFAAQAKLLRYLELKYVAVTDATVEAIKKSLPDLATLKMFGTSVTLARAEKFRKENPGIDFDFRAGGFLGVGCQPHDLGCLIARVQSNTAASKAGLQPGDIILSYRQKRVPDFDELTRLISQDSVGSTVDVKVVRDIRTMVIAINFRRDGKISAAGKSHPLGFQFEKADENSPLNSTRKRERTPFPSFITGDLKKNDVIYRIDGTMVQDADSTEKAYRTSCNEIWEAALNEAKREIERELDPKDNRSKEERQKLIDARAELIASGKAVLLQFSRGGVIVEQKIQLGAWD